MIAALVLATLASLTVGCGSSGDGSGGKGCTTPDIVGDVFAGGGTATVTGTGTLPDGIADGLEVGVLVSTGGASFGVLPDNLLAANDRVCGKSVRYTIKKVEAGTHRLAFEVHDPNSSSSTPLYEGTADADFTIADGQTVNVDATFQISK